MHKGYVLIVLLVGPSPLAVGPSVHCPRVRVIAGLIPLEICSYTLSLPPRPDCSCLQRFVGVEYLDGTNKYKCPKHNQKVRAAKQMAIEQAPNVLVLQLKRFEFSAFGHKISEMVSLTPFPHCQWLCSCTAGGAAPGS